MPEYVNVSVIIPCYRCCETIERAVASVAAQTHKPAELILIDDCSGDGTLVMLNELKTQYQKAWIKVIACPVNGGAATARNVGWAAATQHYIAFLDSDDSWHPQKVELQYGWMMKNPEVTLTGHAYREVATEASAERQVQPFRDLPVFYEVNKNQLLLSNLFPTRSVMLRRNIPQRFPDGKRHSEDYQLWLEICCAGMACFRTDMPLAFSFKSDFGDAGLSAALWKMEKGELNSYYSIYRNRGITWPQLIALCGWSLLKYFKRVLKVHLRKSSESA